MIVPQGQPRSTNIEMVARTGVFGDAAVPVRRGKLRISISREKYYDDLNKWSFEKFGLRDSGGMYMSILGYYPYRNLGG